MPYILKHERNEIDINVDINAGTCYTAGQLNYAITRLLKQYIRIKGENYQTYNDCMGVLEGAKLELYRRRIAGYEDTKIISNGDVYNEG